MHRNWSKIPQGYCFVCLHACMFAVTVAGNNKRSELVSGHTTAALLASFIGPGLLSVQYVWQLLTLFNGCSFVSLYAFETVITSPFHYQLFINTWLVESRGCGNSQWVVSFISTYACFSTETGNCLLSVWCPCGLLKNQHVGVGLSDGCR